jgi:hypothetical protein
MTFTSRQKEILEVAKEKGFIKHEDFVRVYSSPISRKANIERFLALKVFTLIDGKFELNAEKLTELDG